MAHCDWRLQRDRTIVDQLQDRCACFLMGVPPLGESLQQTEMGESKRSLAVLSACGL